MHDQINLQEWDCDRFLDDFGCVLKLMQHWVCRFRLDVLTSSSSSSHRCRRRPYICPSDLDTVTARTSVGDADDDDNGGNGVVGSTEDRSKSSMLSSSSGGRSSSEDSGKGCGWSSDPSSSDLPRSTSRVCSDRWSSESTLSTQSEET